MESFLPIILAIVYAAYSLYTKIKKPTEESRKRVPATPPMQETVPMYHDDDTQKNVQSESLSTNSYAMSDMEASWSSSMTTPYQEGRNVNSNNLTEKKSSSSKLQVKKFTKENVIQGVVMAEILGPPRALRSHRSLRNNKLPN